MQHVTRALLSACRRPADVVARYGGEEFILLLPQTPRLGAQHMAQQVLTTVAGLAFSTRIRKPRTT
jgi:diguanylate cyclase (GGDEF)-like protein